MFLDFQESYEIVRFLNHLDNTISHILISLRVPELWGNIQTYAEQTENLLFWKRFELIKIGLNDVWCKMQYENLIVNW